MMFLAVNLQTNAYGDNYCDGNGNGYYSLSRIEELYCNWFVNGKIHCLGSSHISRCIICINGYVMEPVCKISYCAITSYSYVLFLI